MNSTDSNNKNESTNNIVEKDVLGLDKNTNNASTTKAKPNRIFIALAVIVVIVVACWLLSK